MGTSTFVSLATDTPLEKISGIGPSFAKRYARLGITTAQEILFHFPRRWEDFSQTTPIGSAKLGQDVVIKGSILQTHTHRSPQKRIWITSALIQDDSGAIRAVWFNQPYLGKLFQPKSNWTFAGTVSKSSSGVNLQNPIFEKEVGVFPIYPETEGISSKLIRRHIRTVLPLAQNLPDPLSRELLNKESLPSLVTALHNIHFPRSMQDANKAKERLAFDELLLISLRTLSIRRDLQQTKAPAMHINNDRLKNFSDSLPFQLTNSQRKAAWEIVQDLSKTAPMNRLLEGDVGSGKTVTALFGAITAIGNGYQVVWMAPTEILAVQHYKTAQQLLKNESISVGILTGSKKEKLDADLLIGTHALLFNKTFERLGMLIVDEQHRFGVKQRAALREKRDVVPHLLSMTATPIPRTLALTLYGDLDLSILDEVPKDRKPIDTSIVPPASRDEAYHFIRQEIAKGRQAFVITPLIEEKKKVRPDEIERKSAVAEYEKLSKKVFHDLKIGLLHGKLKPKEKQVVMEKFSKGDLDILVSTAVVEVGIDVPNATVMMIESAERFGLAQLHQLRGRVGRGEHQSYCFCFTESWSEETKRRLREFTTAKNGFELAEIDLELRGPGEMTGLKQSGLPDLKMASLTDSFMIQKARRAAEQILDDGIENYPVLQRRLLELTHARHLE